MYFSRHFPFLPELSTFTTTFYRHKLRYHYTTKVNGYVWLDDNTLFYYSKILLVPDLSAATKSSFRRTYVINVAVCYHFGPLRSGPGTKFALVKWCVLIPIISGTTVRNKQQNLKIIKDEIFEHYLHMKLWG